MLHLYQSNRLEDLAAMMVKLQTIQPLSSPLQSEEVVVQSQGMRRYVNQYLARTTGIAANLRFSLPAQLSWRLMCDNLGDLPRHNPFESGVMRWRLLALFQSAAFAQNPEFQAAFGVLHGYLNNGTFAAYELAGQLADIFDQYLVYRPDWLTHWSSGMQPAELSNCDAAIWQAQLWRYLDSGSQVVPHRAALWQQLMLRLAQPKLQTQGRYFVFGIATLAPMYLDLLQQLALSSDVHILALNPSEKFWGDVIEPVAILQQDGDLSQQGHPLLASLGKQGRDFFNQLAEAGATAHLDLDTFADEAVSGSLLHSLQYHIQTQMLPETALQEKWLATHLDYLANHVFPNNNVSAQRFQAACAASETMYTDEMSRLPENDNDIVQAEKATQAHQRRLALAQLIADDSIQIHSAHSPLRELQILKHRLLALLHQHPDLQPHDIAVLTPNIEPYVPFIEAVFGQHAPDNRPLPYSIADVRHSQIQPFMLAWEQVLQLLQSRFESEKVLALLDHALIRRRFKIGDNDVPLLQDTVAQLAIHWGADAAQRHEYGSHDDLFTWQQGLNRLIAGWMLPENPNTLWQGIAPYASRPDNIAVLSRFVALLTLLSDTRRAWQNPCGSTEWVARLRQLHSDLFAPDDQDAAAIRQFENSLSAWQQETESADFRQSLDADTALHHISRYLNSQSDAGFLRGGITFCSMVPMRSLPFEVLCLLGLNDGSFPRTTSTATFDLIAQHPKRGDRARRDDDRYLFLEAIMSARRHLHLSYVGKDIRTDETRAPSILLNELTDVLAAQSNVPAKMLWEHWLIQHPLHAFSHRYFSGSPSLSSSRSDYAEALNQAPQPIPVFTDKLPETHNNNEKRVAQNDFLRFWRNPVRTYLHQQFSWQAVYTQEQQASAEPFQAENTSLLNQAYLQARRNKQDFADTAHILHAQSRLPSGIIGELTAQSYAHAAAALNSELIHASILPPQTGILTLHSGSLQYHLNHNTEHGQILYADRFLSDHNKQNKLHSSDKIELLLRHLIYCAVQTTPQASHYVSLIQNINLPAIVQTDAQAILSDWLAAYHAGQHAPLPFFPRVNYAAAITLCQTKHNGENKTWQEAEAAATQKYHGGYQGFAQEDYPEVRLVYGHDTEPPYRQQAFQNLTENLLLAPALIPCLKALENKTDNASA